MGILDGVLGAFKQNKKRDVACILTWLREMQTSSSVSVCWSESRLRRFRLMRHLKSVRSLQAGLVSALLASACTMAHAQDACSDERVKDFFVQGGEQVIEDSHLEITSLSQDEVVAQSDRSLTCRYLMELSDHSKRWVRFTYSLDEAGEPTIDFEEETKSTSR